MDARALRRLSGPFKSRNYRLYFIGQSASLVGTWIETIALSWLVLHMTGSGAWLGVVIGARYAPVLLFGPIGGVLADRFDSRRILLFTQSIDALIAATLAVLTFGGWATVSSVMVLSGALGMVNVLDNPARQTLIHSLVSAETLRAAIGLSSFQSNVARVLGPTIAGFIIAWPGLGACFSLNSVSFFGVVISLALMRRDELRVVPGIERISGQLLAGVRYILHERRIFISLLMVTLCGAFVWEFPVSLPLIAENTFGGGAVLYGIFYACLGAGAIVGALAMAATSRRVTLASASAAALLWGAFMCAAGLAPSRIVEMLCLIGAGFGAGSFSTVSKTFLQMTADDQMRGRVMSTWFIGWSGTRGVGGPVVGWIGQELGARWSLVFGGLVALLVGGIGRGFIRSRERVEGGDGAVGDK